MERPPGTPPYPEFHSTFRVRSYEMDALGHANHATYLNWFEQARLEALEAGGWPITRIIAEGWAIVVVRIEVDYLKETRYGDVLEVSTRVVSTGRTSFVLAQEMTRDDEVVSRARVVAVCVSGTGRPVATPPDLRAFLTGEDRLPPRAPRRASPGG